MELSHIHLAVTNGYLRTPPLLTHVKNLPFSIKKYGSAMFLKCSVAHETIFLVNEGENY